MNKVIVFTANIKLDSLVNVIKSNCKLREGEKLLFISPHRLFRNEKEKIESEFGNVLFYCFADFISPDEVDGIDTGACRDGVKDLFTYIESNLSLKNELVIKRIKEKYGEIEGIVLSDDLGVIKNVWEKSGFIYYESDKYYIPAKENKIKKNLRKVDFLRKIHKPMVRRRQIDELASEVYVSEFNGKKLVFIGKMSRIAYRMNLNWENSQEEAARLKKQQFYKKSEGQYLTTIHESYKLEQTGVLDAQDVDVRMIQDGYLPANDNCEYYKYYPRAYKYYAWDTLGEMQFKKYNMPISIMPFRKKLYLPHIKINHELREVLIATSGPGDWTAIKNRSDDDILLEGFIEAAKALPNISFVYRAHPAWVKPGNCGVNSINRVIEYIEYENLKNFRISSNIPSENNQNSFSRTSLEKDLETADLVFGIHSVSMIDATLKGIPFASVNLANRRNLAQSLNDMGFPDCESVADIVNLLKKYNTEDFVKQFNTAVDNYNKMTDEED